MEIVRCIFSLPAKANTKQGVKSRLSALFDLAARLVVLSILVVNIWHSDVKNVIRSRPRGP